MTLTYEQQVLSKHRKHRRNIRLWWRWRRGDRQVALAEEFGLTRQRIEQIVRQYDREYRRGSIII